MVDFFFSRRGTEVRREAETLYSSSYLPSSASNPDYADMGRLNAFSENLRNLRELIG
jgi:hypothetical protein